MSKTALITGASNGIGYEMAKVLAMKDINLVLVARNKSKLDELKNELEGKQKVWVYTIGKDLSQADSAKEVYDELKTRSISIDYLVNNAGFGDFGPFVESEWDKQEQMINLNITTLTYFTRLFLADMICRGGGKVLNVASTASFQPGPTMAVYFATKAYVLSFSEAVNDEVRKHRITVTALCPGPTDSGFQRVATKEGSKLHERNNLATSKEVAEYGYKAMMKGKAVAIHGFKNILMANSVRFAPRSLVVKLTRKIQEKKF
jgi:short-subunit dehydrogenase